MHNINLKNRLIFLGKQINSFQKLTLQCFDDEICFKEEQTPLGSVIWAPGGEVVTIGGTVDKPDEEVKKAEEEKSEVDSIDDDMIDGKTKNID